MAPPPRTYRARACRTILPQETGRPVFKDSRHALLRNSVSTSGGNFKLVMTMCIVTPRGSGSVRYYTFTPGPGYGQKNFAQLVGAIDRGVIPIYGATLAPARNPERSAWPRRQPPRGGSAGPRPRRRPRPPPTGPRVSRPATVSLL